MAADAPAHNPTPNPNPTSGLDSGLGLGVGVRGRFGTLRRIFQLMRIHAYLDLLFLTRNVREMSMWVLSDLIVAVTGVSAVYLLAERFGSIGSWHKAQIVFMLGYGLLVHSLIEMFCGYNIAWISRRIGRGQLDHTLIQPQPLWMA